MPSELVQTNVPLFPSSPSFLLSPLIVKKIEVKDDEVIINIDGLHQLVKTKRADFFYYKYGDMYDESMEEASPRLVFFPPSHFTFARWQEVFFDKWQLHHFNSMPYYVFHLNDIVGITRTFFAVVKPLSSCVSFLRPNSTEELKGLFVKQYEVCGIIDHTIGAFPNEGVFVFARRMMDDVVELRAVATWNGMLFTRYGYVKRNGEVLPTLKHALALVDEKGRIVVLADGKEIRIMDDERIHESPYFGVRGVLWQERGQKEFTEFTIVQWREKVSVGFTVRKDGAVVRVMYTNGEIKEYEVAPPGTINKEPHSYLIVPYADGQRLLVLGGSHLFDGEWNFTRYWVYEKGELVKEKAFDYPIRIVSLTDSKDGAIDVFITDDGWAVMGGRKILHITFRENE